MLNFLPTLDRSYLNEVGPGLLNVYDSWAKFGTIGVTSRTGIISATYRKGDKKDIADWLISLLILDHKIYTNNS